MLKQLKILPEKYSNAYADYIQRTQNTKNSIINYTILPRTVLQLIYHASYLHAYDDHHVFPKTKTNLIFTLIVPPQSQRVLNIAYLILTKLFKML